VLYQNQDPGLWTNLRAIYDCLQSTGIINGDLMWTTKEATNHISTTSANDRGVPVRFAMNTVAPEI